MIAYITRGLEIFPAAFPRAENLTNSMLLSLVPSSKTATNLIQFDLGAIHITQPNSNSLYTNNQVLQLEYNLVMSNYTSTQPASVEPSTDPVILAPSVSTKPEGVLISSFMRVGNL